jgi:hypothetical protein
MNCEQVADEMHRFESGRSHCRYFSTINNKIQSRVFVYDAPPGSGKSMAAAKLCTNRAGSLGESVIMSSSATHHQIMAHLTALRADIPPRPILSTYSADTFYPAHGEVAVVPCEFWARFCASTRRLNIVFERVIVDDYDEFARNPHLPAHDMVWFLVSNGFKLATAPNYLRRRFRDLTQGELARDVLFVPSVVLLNESEIIVRHIRPLSSLATFFALFRTRGDAWRRDVECALVASCEICCRDMVRPRGTLCCGNILCEQCLDRIVAQQATCHMCRSEDLTDAMPLYPKLGVQFEMLNDEWVEGRTVIVTNCLSRIAWVYFGGLYLTRHATECSQVLANFASRSQIPLILTGDNPGYGLALGNVQALWFAEPYNTVDEKRIIAQCLPVDRITPLTITYFCCE